MRARPSSTSRYMFGAITAGIACAITALPAVAAAPAANPFALGHSGLPHHGSLEKDQATWRIREDIARQLITRVFREEGVALNPAHTYEKGEVRFLADGYAPEFKIGYILARPANLEPDALTDWLLASVQHIDASPELVRRYLETMRESLPEDFRAEADAALRLTDTKSQQEAIQYIRREMWRLSGAGRTRLSLAEAQELERMAAAGEEFVAVISHYDSRFCAPNCFQRAETEIREKLVRARRIKDPAKRREKRNKIINRAQERATKAQAKASQEALAQLEATTREYVRWARAKGRTSSPANAL